MTNKAVAKIVRESEPINLEFPFDTLDSMITLTEAFYVRNHFPEPETDLKSWRLAIEGAVSRPLSLSYEQLLAMPKKTVTSVMECAGNSRVFLVPKVPGAQWGLGAVGNAEWTGVPLHAVLEKVGVNASAIEIVFEGADKGVPEEKPKPKEAMHYARSLPVSKAADENILLAYEMNGEPLTKSHGFPLRLIVPGWYGMASVKWLQRIIVAEYAYDGYFQKIDYAYWLEKDGLQIRESITEMELKSQIAQPIPHAVHRTNEPITLKGAAWTGRGEIVKVEITVDGGINWSAAQLTKSEHERAWVHWSYDWVTPAQPQSCILMSRATDSNGRTQELERDLKRDNYRICHTIPIPVHIR